MSTKLLLHIVCIQFIISCQRGLLVSSQRENGEVRVARLRNRPTRAEYLEPYRHHVDTGGSPTEESDSHDNNAPRPAPIEYVPAYPPAYGYSLESANQLPRPTPPPVRQPALPSYIQAAPREVTATTTRRPSAFTRYPFRSFGTRRHPTRPTRAVIYPESSISREVSRPSSTTPSPRAQPPPVAVEYEYPDYAEVVHARPVRRKFVAHSRPSGRMIDSDYRQNRGIQSVSYRNRPTLRVATTTSTTTTTTTPKPTTQPAAEADYVVDYDYEYRRRRRPRQRFRNRNRNGQRGRRRFGGGHRRRRPHRRRLRTTTTTTTTVAPAPEYYDDDYAYDDYPYEDYRDQPATQRTTTPVPRRETTAKFKIRRVSIRPTVKPVPTVPTTTLSPGYKERSDGRIIDYNADPNFPFELKGADLTEYPFLIGIPSKIDFDCKGRLNGYYADIEFGCQVYHHCAEGYRYDHLCANFTIFDQVTYTCRFVNKVECDKSEKNYKKNAKIYEGIFSDVDYNYQSERSNSSNAGRDIPLEHKRLLEENRSAEESATTVPQTEDIHRKVPLEKHKKVVHPRTNRNPQIRRLPPVQPSPTNPPSLQPPPPPDDEDAGDDEDDEEPEEDKEKLKEKALTEHYANRKVTLAELLAERALRKQLLKEQNQ